MTTKVDVCFGCGEASDAGTLCFDCRQALLAARTRRTAHDHYGVPCTVIRCKA